MEVCRLCLDLATASDVKKLEGTYKDATQIVLPELNTDISSSPVICPPCTSSLDELYAFKASVVEAEHQIKEKVGDDKCQLQLKEVMTGVKIDKDADLGKSKDRMCRTCLCAIEGETFTVLKPTQTDAYLNSMLLMCLPEMDLELTLDPVMCEQCLCNLQKLYHFKSSCLDVEERLNNYCQQHGTSSSNQINLHSVLEEDAAESKHNDFAAVKSEPIDSSVGDYKSEEDDEDVSMSDNSKDLGYTVVKVKKEERDMALKEEDDTEDGDESMGDDDGNITDEEIGELKQEELKIEDDEGDGSKKRKRKTQQTPDSYIKPPDTFIVISDRGLKVIYKCSDCFYTSVDEAEIHAHNHNEHIIQMEETSINSNKPVKLIYTCSNCPFTTHDHPNLQRHYDQKHAPRVRGNNKNEIKPTKARSSCSQNTNTLELQDCEHCFFIPENMEEAKLHYQRFHTNQYRCPSCEESSSSQNELQQHNRTKHFITTANGVITERGMFMCLRCTYVALTCRELYQHVHQRHAGNTTENKFIYQCGSCSFKAVDFVEAQIHSIYFHTDIYVCPYCSFACTSGEELEKHNDTMHFTIKVGTKVKTPMYLKICQGCRFVSTVMQEMTEHLAAIHTSRPGRLAEESKKRRRVKLTRELTNNK